MSTGFTFEVLDIETVNIGGETLPYAIAYTDGVKTSYIRIPGQSKNEAAVVLIKIAKNKTIYYVHNLMFDFMVLIRALIKLQVRIRWVYVDHSLYSATLKYGGKSFELRCSYKIIPIKLKRFYPDLSSKPKLVFPYAELMAWNPNKLVKEVTNFNGIGKQYLGWTLDKYLQEYTMRDAEVLKEGIQTVYKVLLDNGIANLTNQLSCGGISLYLFKTKYNTLNLDLPRDTEAALRHAYFGGRCEIFGNPGPDEQIAHFDFKGMYQQCMMESVPCGEFIYQNCASDFNKPGFYYVEVNVTGHTPVLPFKENKLLFPEGKISGWYWFEELQLAVSENQLSEVKIIAALLCKEYKPFLAEFIENLDRVRETSAGFKAIGKLLINAFYGRLGLKESFETINFSEKEKNCDLYAKIEDIFLYKTRRTKKRDSNVGVAAAITAKARIKLYRGFKSVWEQQGRVLYCDTDSIFAAFDLKNNVQGRDIGGGVIFEPNVNNFRIKDIVFIAPKTYGLLFEDQSELIRIKGIDGSHIPFQELKTSFYSKKESILTQTPIILKHNFEIKIENTYKRVACNEYDKRVWTENLKSTTPKKIK